MQNGFLKTRKKTAKTSIPHAVAPLPRATGVGI
jgi:hypothetical protein